MKKILLTLAVALVGYCSYAQNTFPSSGNVGIGTTSPQSPLHIFQSASNSTGLIIQGSTVNIDGAQRYIAMTFDGDYGNATGNYSQIRSYSNLYSTWGSQLAFFTTQTGIANTLLERMRIDYNGNVGIGTASPLFKLDVKTGINEHFLIRSASDWGGSRTGMAIDSRNDAENASVPLLLRASSFEFNQGNVGIGTTSPGYKLDVNGDVGIETSGKLNVGSDLAHSSYIKPIWNDNNNTGLQFHTFAASTDITAMTLSQTTGNVGIGTTSPSTALQLGDFSNGSSNNQLLIPGTYNFEQVRLGQIGNGNSALEFVNHTGVSPSYGIKFLVDIDGGAPGLQLQYAPSTTSYALLSYTTGLYMNLSGNVGIGTINPDTKLAVQGTIHSTEVKVDLHVPVPDYVFKPDYKLTNLSEVKAYVDKNHHLPEIPSAKQIAKDGLNLGEMNTKLLKKVEELTLYLIEKDKQLSAQEVRLKKIESKLNTLTAVHTKK